MDCAFNSEPSIKIAITNSINDSVEIFSFSKLQENVNSIVFPSGWSRHDIPGKLIMFSFFIVITEETANTDNYIPTPILYKRVCLGVNLNFQGFVMNISVNNDLFGLNRSNCTKDLEDILKKIDTSVVLKDIN